ncbi:MAG: hypothetical protein ACYDAD_03135 [Acidimicrobiales bacterium]
MTFRAHGLAALAAAGLLTACSSSSSPRSAAPKHGLAAEVASYDLAVGPPTRLLVGVFAADQRPVGYGTVSMRFCYLGTGKSNTACAPGPASTATFLPIPGTTPPSPLPKTPAFVDAATQRGVYATTAAFDRAGFWQVEIGATVGSKAYTATAAFDVADRHVIPDVGNPAPPTTNLTLTTPGAPPAAIDSRASSVAAVPDAELHHSTIAAALAAHRPAVVVFATPVYCISRFCGPVTDMVQGLAHDYADRASFIHVEIWRDYQNQKLNDAATEWLLQPNGDLNEPWVFVIGADGKIAARFDNVTTRGELEPILRQLPVIGPAA